MRRRFQQYRDIGSATFPLHQRGLDIFGALSIFMLIGVSISGLWQFFFHESNPDWFGYVPDANFSVRQPPATGMAQVHGLFSLGCGIVALVGSAWFAYRIVHRVPLASLVAFGCILFAALTESLVRFNVIQIAGLSFDQVGPGYTQVFTSDLEYVVTDVGQSSAWSFQLLVASHVATVPVLVGFAYWSIVRAMDRRSHEIENATERSWFKTIGNS